MCSDLNGWSPLEGRTGSGLRRLRRGISRIDRTPPLGEGTKPLHCIVSLTQPFLQRAFERQPALQRVVQSVLDGAFCGLGGKRSVRCNALCNRESRIQQRIGADDAIHQPDPFRSLRVDRCSRQGSSPWHIARERAAEAAAYRRRQEARPTAPRPIRTQR